MSSVRRFYRSVFVLCLFYIFGILFTGCFSSDPEYIYWRQFDAFGGEISVEYNEPPAYGSHTLHFFFFPEGASEPQKLGWRVLNNDGANLGDENMEVLSRTPDIFRFVLRGQQQKDEYLEIRKSHGILDMYTVSK